MADKNKPQEDPVVSDTPKNEEDPPIPTYKPVPFPNPVGGPGGSGTLENRLKNWDFLGRCYNVLNIDPLQLEKAAKFPMALDFTEFENIADGTASKPKAMTYIPATGGETQLVTEEITSAYDFQSYFTKNSSLTVSDSTGAAFSASMSDSYKDTARQTGSEQRTITIASRTVRSYGLELVEDESQLKLAEKFRMALADLPDDDSQAATGKYDRLVKDFGTHYAQSAMMGGRVSQIISMTKSSYLNLLQREVNLTAEASGNFANTVKIGGSQGAGSNVSDEFKRELSKSEEKTIFVGGTPGEWGWQNSVHDRPSPIEVRLVPLYELVNETLLEGEAVGAKRERLKQAIERYLKESAGEDPAKYRLNYGDEVELVLAVSEGLEHVLSADNPKYATTRAKQRGAAPEASTRWSIIRPTNPDDRGAIRQGDIIALVSASSGELLDAKLGKDPDGTDGLAAVKGKDRARNSAQWRLELAGQRTREGKAVVSGDYVKLYRQWNADQDGGPNCLLGDKKGTGAEQKVFSYGKKKNPGTNWVIRKVAGADGPEPGGT